MTTLTREEKHARMMERNAAICAFYKEGHSLKECASKFQLGRQRTLQVLQAAGAWKPYVKTERTKFLGVNISEETKDALKKKADEEGLSVSRLTSDILDEAVR